MADVVRHGRLRWFGHVERKNGDDWVSAYRNVVVAGMRCAGGAGRIGELDCTLNGQCSGKCGVASYRENPYLSVEEMYVILSCF